MGIGQILVPFMTSQRAAFHKHTLSEQEQTAAKDRLSEVH